MTLTDALDEAAPDPLGFRWARARRGDRTYLTCRAPDGVEEIQVAHEFFRIRRYRRVIAPPARLCWRPLRKPWAELPPVGAKTPPSTRRTDMETTANGDWECGCGRDNPERALKCGLCGCERGKFEQPDFRNPLEHFHAGLAKLHERFPDMGHWHFSGTEGMTIEDAERRLAGLEAELEAEARGEAAEPVRYPFNPVRGFVPDME